MKKFLRRIIHKDNSGMSIVTVIVAIGFVAILVSILMMASVVNFKMKSVNVYAKDSFYSAEQVLDEINVGLQQWVSDGLSYAYTDVMTRYNDEDLSASDKNNLVRAAYYQYMWDKLGGGSAIEIKDSVTHKTFYKYIAQPVDNSAAGLYGLLKPTTRWNPDPDPDKTWGAFLRSTETDGSNYMGIVKTYESEGIVLEDLTVYYKDPNGFISAIKTDIKLGYPEFAFSDTDIPDISNYVFITDTAFIQENEGSAVDTTIKGNTYAYAYDVKGSKIENKPITGDVDLHIVATDLGITKGGFITNNNSALWARDIELKSSDMTLAGQTYVLDDLNIKGRNCNIALKGYYTGFGNSTVTSKESSAILVNGANTSIDLSAIRKLTLAGRGYIGTSDAGDKIGRVKEYLCTNPACNRTTSSASDITTCPHCGQESLVKMDDDVYTGESIAVKSNQLMYLVPGECIGVTIDDAGKPTTSLYGKNPLTLDEYNEIATRIKNGGKYVMVSGIKPLTKLGGTDAEGNTMNLSAFAQTDANGNPKVEKVFLPTADGSSRLVYFYMTFKDEEAANTYFTRYYNLNKSSVDKYMDKYLKAITMPTTGAVSLKVDLAGMAVDGHAVAGDEDTYEIADFTHVPDAGNTISEDFTALNTEYKEQYQAYCSKLSSDYATIADSANADILRTVFPEYDAENNKMKIAEGSAEDTGRSYDETNHKYYNDNYYTVFKNLIDEEILKDMVGGGDGQLTLTDSDGNKVLLIYNSNVNSTHSVSGDYNLVIANCGVTLSSNTFKGLIIAKGIIKTPTGNVTLEADPDKVGTCFLMETDDAVYKVSDVFGDTDELSYTSALKGTGEAVTTASLVTYENWTKNVEIK